MAMANSTNNLLKSRDGKKAFVSREKPQAKCKCFLPKQVLGVLTKMFSMKIFFF